MDPALLSLTARTALETARRFETLPGSRQAPIGEIAVALGVEPGALARALFREALDLREETGREVLRLVSHDMPQTLPADRRPLLEAGTHKGFNLLQF